MNFARSNWKKLARDAGRTKFDSKLYLSSDV